MDEYNAAGGGPGALAGRLASIAAIALCLAAALALAWFTDSASPAAPPAARPAVPSRPASDTVRIGLVDLSTQGGNSRDIDATLKAVRAALAPRGVELRRFKAEKLDQLVRAGKVDFFVASAGFYWRMKPYGASSLATIVSPRRPDPNHYAALAFIVRADSALQTVGDLKGKTLSTTYPTAFMGYRTGMAEIAHRGYDWESFFGKTLFSGSPHLPGILAPMEDGRADVAFVAACSYEEMAPGVRAKYRVIEPREVQGIPCLASTAAYPGLTFAVMNGVEPALARAVTATLLAMPVSDKTESWSIATDFTEVDRLYEALRLGPYSYLREPSLKRWAAEHRQWLYLAFLLIAGLAAHSLRSNLLVERRTRELLASEAERNDAHRKLQEMNERMERVHKANVVAQLSSMVSHELSQPLAAIRYYTEGAGELLRGASPDRGMLVDCNGKISAQADRAIAIVDKVRSYAKSSARREERVELPAVIRHVLEELKVKGIGGVAVRTGMPEQLAVQGDPLEVELLFWNLLKNAVEASLRADSPTITVDARAEGRFAVAVLENSGDMVSEETFERLMTPLGSSKENGLGLGLSIVRSVAESSGGGVEFARRPQGGLSVRVRLPLWEDAPTQKE